MRRARQKDRRLHSTRALTAAHEAGHAIACVVTGRAFTSVDIIATDEQHGQCEMDDLPEDAPREQVAAEAVCCLAGMLAESRATGEAFPCGGEDDLIDAFRLADRIDLDLIDAWAETEAMVEREWPRISRIAEVLLDERVLSASDVRVLLEAA